MLRNSISLLLFLLLLEQAHAQSAALVPVRRGTPTAQTLSQLLGTNTPNDVIQTVGDTGPVGAALVDTAPIATSVASLTSGIQSIDSQTTWAFQLREEVVLSSPIVRLGDIAEPLNPNLAAWPRLKRVSVGLLPTDGTPMVIQRDRLSHAITTIEATPRQIDWYGKSETTVHYDSKLASQLMPESNASERVVYQTPMTQQSRKQAINTSQEQPTVQTAFETELADKTDQASLDEQVVLDPITRDRIRYWIELAIRRELRELGEEYEVTVDDRDSVIAPFAAASSLASIELDETAHEGQVNLSVIGRHRDGPIVVKIPLTLKSHPRVVIANMNLQRGERIGISDVRLSPLPKKLWRDAYATSIDTVIGQEVRGIVREGAPISLKEIGPQTLVHRGDLVELRVVGGGVTITTNAKSIDEGAFAELIEVETIQPRRRVIAKVVSSGLVEIITQSPVVK